MPFSIHTRPEACLSFSFTEVKYGIALNKSFFFRAVDSSSFGKPWFSLVPRLPLIQSKHHVVQTSTFYCEPPLTAPDRIECISRAKRLRTELLHNRFSHTTWSRDAALSCPRDHVRWDRSRTSTKWLRLSSGSVKINIYIYINKRG